MSVTLRELWNQQFDDGSNLLTKEAAAHGMSNDEYIQAVAAESARYQKMEKLAESNKLAYGILVGEGIRHGIRTELSKAASITGAYGSAERLFSVFCD